jgi:hypothetical protein
LIFLSVQLAQPAQRISRNSQIIHFAGFTDPSGDSGKRLMPVNPSGR